MNRDDERLLARVTSGVADAAEREELARRARLDPRLEAVSRRWVEAWQGLELPSPEPPPPGFAARVVARARAAGAEPDLGAVLGLRAHPALARLAAILIVGVGAALGAGVAALAPSDVSDASDDPTAEVWTVESLADSYLAAATETDAGAEVEP